MNSDVKLEKLKETVYKANKKLYEDGLVSSTFVNISGIDRDTNILANFCFLVKSG